MKCCVLAGILCVNLGILVFLKYFNFVITNLKMVFPEYIQMHTFNLLLPLGISFYTLQVVGYCIDIYRGKYKPEKNIVKYALFVSFFPHILQGPIARYDMLGFQLYKEHNFNSREIKFGLELMIWGFFKKMVIADRAAILVNQVFNNYQDYAGFQILVASVFYTIQLYADFSGCVDIVTGASQIFGIKLSKNFNRPYFAKSIQDFWRRWHISLSSWFRDYLYITLGGNRKGTFCKYCNIIIVFLVSGFWHGVGFHYIIWGFMHGAYQVIGALLMPLRKWFIDKFEIDKTTFSYKLFQVLITFSLINFAWIFFRAESLNIAIKMIKSSFTTFNPWIFFDDSLFLLGLDQKDFHLVIISFLVLLIVSLLQRKYKLREELEKQNVIFRVGIYVIAVFSVLYFGIYGPEYNASQFIYGQF
jgi:Predicted membrane protein involved in D-alanine export